MPPPSVQAFFWRVQPLQRQKTAASSPRGSGSENQEQGIDIPWDLVGLLPSSSQLVTPMKTVRINMYISLQHSQASDLTKVPQIFMKEKLNLMEKKK